MTATAHTGRTGGASALFSRRKILSFFCIGAVSTLVDIGLLYVLTEYLGIWYLASAALSYFAGILVNYSLNRNFTFHDTDHPSVVQFTTFNVISIGSLAVNLGIIWCAVELFAVNYLLAKVIATFFSFLGNYYGQSRFTFHVR